MVTFVITRDDTFSHIVWLIGCCSYMERQCVRRTAFIPGSDRGADGW